MKKAFVTTLATVALVLGACGKQGRAEIGIMEGVEKQTETMTGFITVYYKELIGAAVIAFLFVIEFLLISKGVIYGGHARKLKRAKEQHHRVLAKLINQARDRNDGTKDIKRSMGGYEYIVDGKVYHKDLTFTGNPPSSVTFYWDKNPKHIFREERDVRPWDILIFIVPVVIGIAIYMNIL